MADFMGSSSYLGISYRCYSDPSSEPILTATTESAVQRILHRRMSTKQQMRWSPRGAHLMLKARAAVMNGTLDRDHVAAARARQLPYPHVADLHRPHV